MIPVVADADTLYGATTRGLLVHLDYCGLIRLHWSPLILEELSRALVETGRKPNAKAAAGHEQLMRAALPHAELPVAVVQKQFRAVAATMHSAKDMHVAACAHAIVAGNYYPTVEVVSLVTNNVRDFGVRRLAALGIKVSRPRHLPAQPVGTRRPRRCRRVRGIAGDAALGAIARAASGAPGRRRPSQDRRSDVVRRKTRNKTLITPGQCKIRRPRIVCTMSTHLLE